MRFNGFLRTRRATLRFASTCKWINISHNLNPQIVFPVQIAVHHGNRSLKRLADPWLRFHWTSVNTDIRNTQWMDGVRETRNRLIPCHIRSRGLLGNSPMVCVQKSWVRVNICSKSPFSLNSTDRPRREKVDKRQLFSCEHLIRFSSGLRETSGQMEQKYDP